MSPYHNANAIAETDLAGCLPVSQDINNFQLLVLGITDRIAFRYKRERAWRIYEVVTLEATGVSVPPFEYVINELQFEWRVSKAWGVENMDKVKESELLERWARHVARKKGNDAALDFINQLKKNRKKRIRS
jgi:hypothetical protein